MSCKSCSSSSSSSYQSIPTFSFFSGEKTRVRVFPANTDSWYIRQAGIPALGFSPIKNTPVLLHDHNEFLHADTYLRGIEIYKKVIECLANA